MTRVLLVDNYDSFTYNVVHLLSTLRVLVTVVRNDATTVDQALSCDPDALVIGPGPGNPSKAGFSKAMIASCCGKIPVLGICLGHQAINEVFGGVTIHAKAPMHGKTSPLTHNSQGIFSSLPQDFSVMRYHSLVVDRARLPRCLTITAQTLEGEVMALRHNTLPIEGVQFHPESILSGHGTTLLTNFLKACNP